MRRGRQASVPVGPWQSSEPGFGLCVRELRGSEAAPSGPQTGDKRGQRAAVRRRSCCQRPDIHQSINVVIDQPPDDRAGPALCADREEDDGPLDEEAAGASLPEFSPIL